MTIRVNKDLTLTHVRNPTGGEKGAEPMNSYNPDAFRNRYRPTETREPRRVEADQFSIRTLSSNSLFSGGEHEIGIEHHGALYRLKITRQGKLILNK
jgi:hemin uptake protein HemP